MKNKVTRNRILKITALVLLVTVCSLLLQEFFLCHSDNNRERIKGFYLEDKDSIDVVFIGASEIYCDYAPTLAYRDYGFTSYPVATQGSTIGNYITAIKEAVRTQHPKLIVIEINGALYNEKDLNNESYRRNYIDGIPLNQNKIDYINKYVTDNKIEYYLPIIKYHNNWTKLPHGVKWDLAIDLDLLRGYTIMKGVKNMPSFFDLDGKKVYNTDKKELKKTSPLEEQSETQLRELLDFCKDENLNVLFTRFPHAVVKKELYRFRRSHTVENIIKEYGFDYITFDPLIEEIGLDPEKDFYNSEHLNIYGQVKFTNYICEYLVDDYSVTPSVLTEKQKKEWDRCARYYDAYYAFNVELFEKGDDTHAGGDLRTLIGMWKYLKK